MLVIVTFFVVICFDDSFQIEILMSRVEFENGLQSIVNSLQFILGSNSIYKVARFIQLIVQSKVAKFNHYIDRTNEVLEKNRSRYAAKSFQKTQTSNEASKKIRSCTSESSRSQTLFYLVSGLHLLGTWMYLQMPYASNSNHFHSAAENAHKFQAETHHDIWHEPALEVRVGCDLQN
jgi:hypothetical protein